MRVSATFLLLLFISACSPMAEPPAAPESRQESVVRPVPVKAAPTTMPAHAISAPALVRGEPAGITFEGVAFDARSHRLVVADQADGPGSRFTDAADAAGQLGGIAAMNAGFFTPEGAPLGLVVAAGKSAGAWNSASSLGSGIWHEDGSGRAQISRRVALDRSAAATMRELLQAGPMLVADGVPVSGLESAKTSARTVLLWDGGVRWCMARTSPCTLAGLAAALASRSPVAWPVHHALNLDGGRSSDLWVSGSINGGPLVRRPPWNRPVRNFLVLRSR